MNVGDLVDAGYAEIKTGPFGTQLRASDYVESGRAVLNVRNVGFGDVRPKDLEYVNEETAARLANHLLQVDDIVFGRKGAVERHAFINARYDGAMQGSDCIRLRVAPDSPMPARFITFALRTQQHQAWMQSFCSHGATMASLNQDIVRQIPLPEIDTDHQELAVAVLQNIDDLIENNRRRVAVLEEMARAIYREWFVKFCYPGQENVPLVGSALGPIPEGWTTPRLAELVSTQYGYTESATAAPTGPKYLRGMDINKTSFIDWSSVPYCPIDDAAADRFRVRVGDVFVIRMADPGKVGICETEVDAVFASYLVRLRPVADSIRPHFLFFTLADTPYQDWVTGASTGATRKSVSAKVMTEPRIALPPVGLQQRLETAVGPMREALTTLVRENAKLAGLRDLLLPRLVTGQVDLSTLDLEVLIKERVAS